MHSVIALVHLVWFTCPFKQDNLINRILVASWTCYGTGKMSGDWSWRIPVVIQAFPAAIIFCTVWLLPESPRWQIANDQREKARSFFVEYHGNGNEDSAIVNLQMEEIERETNYDKELSNNRWWDYRPLFSTRDRCFRIYLLILVGVFNKFVGGAVIRYATLLYFIVKCPFY